MLKRYSKYMSLEEFRLRLGFKNFQKKVSLLILVKGFPIRFIITFVMFSEVNIQTFTFACWYAAENHW